MLPSPRFGALVFAERVNMSCDGPLVPRWAKAQVEFVQHPLRRRCRNRCNQALCKATVIMGRCERLLTIRFLGIWIVTIEKDEIDIRACSQFAATEFSHPKYRDFAPRHAAMAGCKLRLDCLKRSTNGQVRQIGKGLPRPLRINRPLHEANTDQKLLLGSEYPQTVEFFFMQFCALQKGLKPDCQIGLVWKF